MAEQTQQRNAPTLRQRIGAAWKALTVRNLTIDEFYERVVEKLGHRVHSGQKVTEETAFRYLTVYACIRVLAETLGSVPLQVLRSRPDGGADKLKDDPRWHLLHNEPNPDMTSQTFFETLTGHIASSGNGYAPITFNRRGEPDDIFPWDWHQVGIDRDKETRRLVYEIKEKGVLVERLPATRMLHVPGLGFDGVRGYSPIAMAREAVGLGLAATEFAGRFYGQGMNFGMVFTTDNTINPGSVAEKSIRDWLEEQGSGMENSWKGILLDGGVKPTRMTIPLRDAQFVEGQKLNDAQVSGIFRVPLHFINHHEGQPRASVEQLALEFLQFTMLSWFRRFEQEINRKLFTRQERANGYYAQFNMGGLLRGTYLERQQGLEIQLRNGALNLDEWRELEDRPNVPDGMGKRHFVPHNMQTIEEAIARGGGDDEDMETAARVLASVSASLRKNAVMIASSGIDEHEN